LVDTGFGYSPEVGNLVDIKNAIFWDVTRCGPCKNIPEGGILHSHRRENLKSDIEGYSISTLVPSTEKNAKIKLEDMPRGTATVQSL
jgi:hypothetical protein